MLDAGTGKTAEPPSSADVVIVGSGIAGGIMAERLTEAGRDCLMLEAGHRYSAADFPVPEIAQGKLFWRQGMEFTSDGRMIVLRGKCVGGSSVVNQALLDVLPDETLQRWADGSGIAWLSDGTMAARYDRLLKSGRFQHQVIPASANNGNARRFLDGMASRGWTSKQLRRAQSDCAWQAGNHCIDCLGGCPRKSKQSALETTLPRAEAQGLTLIHDIQVQQVREIAGGGVRLSCLQNSVAREIEARTVILAAGSLGTTEILLRSGLKATLPATGEMFHLHPQFNTFARFDEPVNGHLHALQSVASDDPSFQARGFKLECITLPRAVMALTLPWSGKSAAQLTDYAYWGGAEVSIRDTEPGRITVSGTGPSRISKALSAKDVTKRDEARRVMADVFRAAGAREIVDGWLSISVHPMGGCGLASDRTRSVVGPDFRVHGMRNIYVCDSSLFPDAPGYNPSLTVMAFADHAADSVLAGEAARV